MYSYIVLLHVIGAFAFALAHGVSIAVALQLRRERSRDRIAALLELSQLAIGGLYVGLLLLLVGGIWAGFAGGHWGRGWIWAAIGILVVITASMYMMATPFYGRMRVAAGVTTDPKTVASFGNPGPEQLEEIARSSRPFALTLIGGIGLVAILWLMVVKPF